MNACMAGGMHGIGGVHGGECAWQGACMAGGVRGGGVHGRGCAWKGACMMGERVW